jgi:Family of unknown function (DUF6178)
MPTNALDQQSPSPLLERLLDTPNLPQVVRELDPQILHRLVRVVGLEDCGEIVSLATPAQLTRVFDVDLWRSDRPGHAERFDAARFGIWLEVLVESGLANAALKVAGLDVDFVTSAILAHVMVIDQAAETAAAVFRQIVNDSQEDEVYERPSIIERIRESGATCEIAGYAIVAKRSESWDALVAVLGALHDEHPDFFHRLMSSCCSVSAKAIEDESGSYELLNAPEQLRFDVAFDREQRREGQGYVTAPQASAFLQSARRIALRADAAPARDDLTRAYFRELERQPRWRERESAAPSQNSGPSPQSEPGMASFMETLREAGVVADTPRALLAEGNVAANDRRSTLTEHMQFVSEHDEDAFTRRNEELGYLANVLVSGCSFNSAEFSAAAAQDAVVATCNLGLENWPQQWLDVSKAAAADSLLPPNFLLRHDLVTVFKVGWTVLFEQVVVYVTRRVIEILSELSSDDSDLHDDLRAVCRKLHTSLRAGTPWSARDHLDVIAILDTPSWAMLLRLIDECPVLSADLDTKTSGRALRVSTDFSFISENRQIARVRQFIEELPDRLVG